MDDVPAFEINFPEGDTIKVYATGKIEAFDRRGEGVPIPEKTIIINRIPGMLDAARAEKNSG